MRTLLHKPLYSTISLLVTLGIFLFATYFFFVPSIVRDYERKLKTQQDKITTIITRMELRQDELAKVYNLGEDNNRLLKEIHERVTRDSGTDSKESKRRAK